MAMKQATAASRRAQRLCTYCGRPADTHEHAIAKNLYPKAARRQLVTVFACRDCNNGWSDDEAHFRNVIAVAGDANEMVDSLWSGPVGRGLFHQVDGQRRLWDLTELMQRVETDHGPRSIIYPARSSRVLRVVRKIVRGLARHHGLAWPVAEDRVWVDVLRHEIPPAFEARTRSFGAVPQVATYGYEMMPPENAEFESAWILTFYERTRFIAMIRRSTGGRD